MAAVTFPRVRTGGDASRTQDNVAATLEQVASAIASTPMAGSVPVWIRPDLLNGHANYNAAGGTYAIAGYYRDAFLRVWSKGTLLNSTGAPLAVTTSIMRFPLGYRPAERQRLTVAGDAATYQFVEVLPDGNVYPGVAVPNGGSMDLFFSFLAEA